MVRISLYVTVTMMIAKKVICFFKIILFHVILDSNLKYRRPPIQLFVFASIFDIACVHVGKHLKIFVVSSDYHFITSFSFLDLTSMILLVWMMYLNYANFCCLLFLLSSFYFCLISLIENNERKESLKEAYIYIYIIL